VVLLGIINILTIAAISEAVARSGVIRYGNAFLGRVVADYLGSIGSFIFTSVLGGIFFMLMLVFYIGVAATLADATSIPAEAWTALLFLVGLYFLSRRSFSATVALTLVARAVTVGLLLILSVLAFAHLRTENLAYAKLPFVGGRPFEPMLLQLIFGTILSIYIAHPAVGNIATITLRRDPSGRSLIWGNVASIVITIIISSIWILAMNGAIAPQTLAGQSGTVLGPLAAVAGPSVHVLGSLLAILSMGMGSIIISLGLFYLVREWLPARSRRIGEPCPEPSRRDGRFLFSTSPVVAAFVLTEWLFLTNGESFASLISFLGVIATSLLGGIFPALLLVASRRKGEVMPGAVYRFLGHPWLIAGIYLLFLAVLFVHGLLIWQNPVERVGALLVGMVMLAATILMVRRGAFTPRVVVELRQDQRGQEQATFVITAAGQPATAEVRLGYPDGERRIQAAAGEIPAFSSLHYANFHLLTPQAQELKVWAHRITPEGDSESLPALLEVHCGEKEQQFDLGVSGEQVVLPLSDEACQVRIAFPERGIMRNAYGG